MKAKKLLALVTAVSLAILPTSTAFATDVDTITGANTSGSTSQTADATVDYLNAADFIKITVPTSASLAFTLDPQNLAGTLGAGEWKPSDGGAIIPAAVAQVVNKSAVPVKTSVSFAVQDDATVKTTLVADATGIDSDSAKKMYLTLTPAKAKTIMTVTGCAITTEVKFFDGTADFSGTATEFSAAALASAGVENSQLVPAADLDGGVKEAAITIGQYVVSADLSTPLDAAALSTIDLADPAYADVTFKQVEVPVIAEAIDATKATTVSEYNNVTTGLASTTKFNVDSAGANMVFDMNSANWYIFKDAVDGYILKYDDKTTNTNYDTASFIIGGSINPNADWSDYNTTDKISLAATYTFDTMTASAYDSEIVGTSKVLITGTHNSIPYVAPNVAPTYFGAETSVSVAKDSSTFSIPFDLGTGTEAVTVTSIALTVTSIPQDFSPVPYTYDTETGSLVFVTTGVPSGYVDYTLSNAATYPFHVTTSDGTTSDIDVVVTP